MRQAVLFGIAAGWAAVVWAQSSGVVLENEAMRILFAAPEDGFAVTGIVNRVDGGEARFVTGKGTPDFWEIEFLRHTPDGKQERFSVNNRTPCATRSYKERENGFCFLWKGVDLGTGEALEREAADVAAEVWFDPSDGMSRWEIHVRSRAKAWALFTTTYPTLQGVIADEQGDVMRPDNALGARLFRDCCWDKGVLGVQYNYPGNFPMLTAYNRGEAGLYIAAHDPACRTKTYICNKGEYMRFKTPVEQAGEVGKAASGPGYPVVIGAYRGDWWTAARIYRTWATRQKWAQKGKKAFRTDYPKQMAESDLWLIANFAYDGVSNLMARAAQAWPDVGKAIEFVEWNHRPFDVGYPEYFPPRKGFAEINTFAKRVGFMTMPYTNGMLWDQDLASYRAFAIPGMTKKVDGSVEEQVWRHGEGRFGTVCPMWKTYHDILSSFTGRLLNQYGVGAVYIDQIGFAVAKPCFDRSHGHVLGGGTHWREGYHTALARLRPDYVRAGAPITTEGMCECWMDVIDGYLNANVPTDDQVPIFTAVYSAYATAFGCRPSSSISAADFRRYQARTTLWGCSPGWVGPWVLDSAHVEHAAALYAAARFRKATREFLAWGSLEDAVRFEAADKDILGTQWLNAAETAHCVALANVGGEARTVRFPLPAKGAWQPVSVPGEQSVVLTADGGRAEVTLPAKSFAAFRIEVK